MDGEAENVRSENKDVWGQPFSWEKAEEVTLFSSSTKNCLCSSCGQSGTYSESKLTGTPKPTAIVCDSQIVVGALVRPNISVQLINYALIKSLTTSRQRKVRLTSVKGFSVQVPERRRVCLRNRSTPLNKASPFSSGTSYELRTRKTRIGQAEKIHTVHGPVHLA